MKRCKMAIVATISGVNNLMADIECASSSAQVEVEQNCAETLSPPNDVHAAPDVAGAWVWCGRLYNFLTALVDVVLIGLGIWGWASAKAPSAAFSGAVWTDAFMIALKWATWGARQPVGSPHRVLRLLILISQLLTCLWVPVGLIYQAVILKEAQNTLIYGYLLGSLISNSLALAACALITVAIVCHWRRRERRQRARLSEQSGQFEQLQDSPLDMIRQLWTNHFSSTFDPTCPICMEPFTEQDKLISLPCHHGFHRQCLEEAVKRAPLNGCPLCRGPLVSPAQVGRISEISSAVV